MNLPYFIAQRLIKGRQKGTSFSRPINVIAVIGIAIGSGSNDSGNCYSYRF